MAPSPTSPSRPGVSDPLWSASARLRRLRPRRRSRSLRGQLPGLHASPATSAATMRVGARDYCSPRTYRPVPDRLYRNEGGGRFIDATEAAGISKADGAGLGVSTGDYNGDGWPDLYVANDATPNQLWINQRNGTFADEGLLSGAALNAAGNPEGSMGIASGDFDLDGDEDLFVTNIVGETFALYVNDGRGQFRRRARARGTLGADRGVHRLRHRLVRLRQRRLARPLHRQRRGQHRRGAARRSRCRSGCGTSCFATPAPGGSRRRARRRARRSSAPRSAAARRSATSTTTATSTSSSPTTTARCGCSSIRRARRNHWLQVRLQQPPGNRFGFGAWVGVERAGRPTLWRRVRTDGSYLSASDVRVCTSGSAPRPAIVGRRRPVARRRARALDGRASGSGRHAAARHGEMKVAGTFPTKVPAHLP